MNKEFKIKLALVLFIIIISLLLIINIITKKDDNSPSSSTISSSSTVVESEKIESSSLAVESSSVAPEPSPQPVKNEKVYEVLNGAYTVPVWNLIYLSPHENNKIDADIPFDKTKFDSQYINSVISENYAKMVEDAKNAGITLFLRSGFRAMSEQSVNYNNAVNRQLAEGHSKEEAIRLTQQYYTVPGHSEHHTGLALDIITPEYHNSVYTLDSRFADTEAYTWLIENCNNYGFILRYPEGLDEITKITFEPWHYRYVGENHAKAITKLGITFDEYIPLILDEFAYICTATDPETIKAEMVIFAENFANTIIK